ncbi:hypothetical protein LXL04_023563 [Taraxacum kok-saghyz]
MTLIYDADAEVDEEMLTLMSKKNRQTDLHSPRLGFVHSEICTAHSHSILERKRKPISTSMKSIRIRNKGGYPINTPTWTDFGRRKEEEIGGAVAQMKASRRSDGSGGPAIQERRERWVLAHLGLSAHCVDDMTTPPVSSSDLLIASAGPGGFSTVDAICGVANTNGARVLVLTAQPESGSSVKYASVVAYTLFNYKIATLLG